MQKIVIIGAGALGSHLVLLARNWEATLRVVDFDRVEQKNTLAQFHSRMGLRQNKAQALQKAMTGLFGVRLDAVPHRLTDDNAVALLGEAALVLDCTDNAEARRVIQRQVRAEGTPCLHGALSADGTFGRVVWDEHFTADEEGEPGQATCEDGHQLPMFALVAAQLAVAAQRFLDSGQQQSFQISPSGIIRLA